VPAELQSDNPTNTCDTSLMHLGLTVVRSLRPPRHTTEPMLRGGCHSRSWSGFTSGWLVGGLSGVAWAYVCTQILPFYN
jgi:hypothetical protein